MLRLFVILSALFLAHCLKTALHQSTKYQTPQETPSPDLNERFNIPTVIRAITKPKPIQGTVRLINKGEKITNKRNAYLQPNFNPSDNAKRTVRDEYSSPILNITKEHPTKQVPNILGMYKPSVARPKNGYSVLSMSSGLHHGTKLEPIASNRQTNLPKQKNIGVLQVKQILNPKCNNFREQFIHCGCERTCINTQGECIYNPCDTGCYCRNGWVRDASQNCVLSSYYCKDPLNNSGFRKNSFVIHEVSTQERRPWQFIQLHQSSRLIPVQFNKPPISLVCRPAIPHQTTYIPQTIIYSEEDYHKLKRAAYSPNNFQNLNPSNWREQKKQNILQLFYEREANVPICNENEDAVRCACEKTCNDPKGKRCQSSCENGCVCKDGFIRIDKNCYHISACGVISGTQSQKITTPKDSPNPFNSARYLKSASKGTTSFPLTFKNFQPLADSKSSFPLPQKLDADEQDDYGITHFSNPWLDTLNISTSGMNGENRMTTSSLTSAQECKENEEYLQCGCERTCSTPDPKCLDCKPGCFCKIGFVKDNFSQCILLNFCPQKI